MRLKRIPRIRWPTRWVRYAIERLEPRCLLTGIINGTADDDTFIISVESPGNTINLLFNGVPQTITPPADGDVEVHGVGGDDTIVLQNTNTLRFFLFGELGNDHFVVGNGQLATDVRRDVLIIGPAFAGNDTASSTTPPASTQETTHSTRGIVSTSERLRSSPSCGLASSGPSWKAQMAGTR